MGGLDALQKPDFSFHIIEISGSRADAKVNPSRRVMQVKECWEFEVEGLSTHFRDRVSRNPVMGCSEDATKRSGHHRVCGGVPPWLAPPAAVAPMRHCWCGAACVWIRTTDRDLISRSPQSTYGRLRRVRRGGGCGVAFALSAVIPKWCQCRKCPHRRAVRNADSVRLTSRKRGPSRPAEA